MPLFLKIQRGRKKQKSVYFAVWANKFISYWDMVPLNTYTYSLITWMSRGLPTFVRIAVEFLYVDPSTVWCEGHAVARINAVSFAFEVTDEFMLCKQGVYARRAENLNNWTNTYVFTEIFGGPVPTLSLLHYENIYHTIMGVCLVIHQHMGLFGFRRGLWN